MKDIANILEVIMLLCFGASWPINLHKAVKARTAKGTSLPFFLLIELGYLCGIMAKVISDNINYVLFFYFLNVFVVGLNIAVYFRNRRIDRGAKREVSDRENRVNHRRDQSCC